MAAKTPRAARAGDMLHRGEQMTRQSRQLIQTQTHVGITGLAEAHPCKSQPAGPGKTALSWRLRYASTSTRDYTMAVLDPKDSDSPLFRRTQGPYRP